MWAVKGALHHAQLEHSARNGMPSNSSHPGPGSCREEEVGVMDDSKEAPSFRCNRTDVHMNSQRLWQHTRVQARRTSSSQTESSTEREWEGDLGGSTPPPPLIRKRFAIYICWLQGNSVFSNEVSQAHQAHCRAGSVPSSWLMQNKLCFLEDFLSCLGIF